MIHLNGHPGYTALVLDSKSPDVEQLLIALKNLNLDVPFFQEGQRAYDYCLSNPPHIVIAELGLPVNGIPFVEQMRGNYTTHHIPIIITTKETSLDILIQAIEKGIDDFIQKPYYPEEVATHVEMILQEIETIVETNRSTVHGFTGKLEEMNLLDIIQTLELGKKSAVVKLNRGEQKGIVYLHEGQIVDAVLNGLQPEQAVRNLFTWLEGSYQVNLQTCHRQSKFELDKNMIQQATLWISQRRQLTSQMPPLATILKAEPTNGEFSLSDPERHLLSIFSIPKSILQAIAESTYDDLLALTSLNSLITKNLLLQVSLPLDENEINDPRKRDLPAGTRGSNQDYYIKIAGSLHVRERKPQTIGNGNNKQNTSDSAVIQEVSDYTKSHISKSDLLLIRQAFTRSQIKHKNSSVYTAQEHWR